MDQEKKLRRSRRWRLFALSFAVTFLIVGLMFLVVAFGALPQNTPPPETQPSFGDGAYLPKSEDRLTLLVIGEDGVTGTLTFALMGFFPDTGNITVAVLPKDTYLEGEHRSDTLSGIYRAGGGEMVSSALSSVLEVSMDRYAVIQSGEFVDLVNRVGSVDFEIPYDLSDTMGQLSLGMGLQQLDGSKMLDVFLAAFPNGEPQRCNLTAQIISTVINTHLPLMQGPEAEEVFLAAVNACETDFTQLDFESRREAARFLAELSVRPAGALSISGMYQTPENVFLLDEQSAELLRSTYGR